MSEVVILDVASESIQFLRRKDKRLAKVIDVIGPIVYTPHTEDAYSFLVHEIIEQMLSMKAGAKIYGRLEELCGGTVTPKAVNALSDEEIKSIGTSSPKVSYIRSLTDALETGSLSFDSLVDMSDEQAIKKLTEIRGIGKWSAKMYLIFALNRQDILPTEDVAFLQGYEWLYKTNDRSEEAIKKKCKKWSPYSSIAARYLYHALDSGMTKDEFHLYGEENCDGNKRK